MKKKLLLKIGKIYNHEEKEELKKENIHLSSDIVSQVLKHKVLSNVLSNMNNLQDNNDRGIHRLKIISKLLTDNNDGIELPEDSMIFKGTAIGRFYPDGYKRVSQDIDVAFFDIKTYFQYIQDQEDKYETERLKIYFDLNKQIRSDLSLLPKNRKGKVVDLHLFPLYIWGGSFLSLNLSERKTKIDGRFYPGVEDSYIILLCNIANEWKYLLRDINDAYILLTQQNIDYSYIMRQVKINKLEDVHYVIINEICLVYPRAQLSEIIMNSKRNFSNWLFRRLCFGECNALGAVLIEFKFSMKHYSEQRNYISAIKMATRDTLFLLKYKRAFPYIDKCIYKIKDHSLFVFTKVESQQIKGGVMDIRQDNIWDDNNEVNKEFKSGNMMWRNVPYKRKEYE